MHIQKERRHSWEDLQTKRFPYRSRPLPEAVSSLKLITLNVINECYGDDH